MPRNQGTSRKGKPGKKDRAAGMGKALQKAQAHRYRPKANGRSRGGGMSMQEGVQSIGLDVQEDRTKSILELHDLDDFLQQADLANREFLSERQGLVVLDDTGQAYRPPVVKWQDERPNFVFTELSVPRRPAWDDTTTPEELERNEQRSFLDWRRAIAVREEELMRTQSSASVTPFEKNIEVWRQLWRVLERCSCLLQLVDARNPLFYLSADLRDYAESLGKPMMVLVNKSDYLSPRQRAQWRDYLTKQGWEPVFFSAALEQKKIDEAAHKLRQETEPDELVSTNEVDDATSSSSSSTSSSSSSSDKGKANADHDDENDVDENIEDGSNEPKKIGALENLKDNSDDHEPNLGVAKTVKSADGQGVDVPLTREQLLNTMVAFAQRHDCKPDPKTSRVQFGMVGFPNVGKSSVINVLVGSSKHAHGVVRVGVAAQPGKTKHFQTLLLPDSDEIMLCDCPGLVFPSFVSNTADLIAAGVYPISQMRDHWPVTNLIAQRIPREILNAHYGIQIPVPSQLDLKERGLVGVPPPTGEEFLTELCHSRGMLAASSGNPDFTRAARLVIKDYAVGKLLYCHPPPDVSSVASFMSETVKTSLANATKLREKLQRQIHKVEEAAVVKDADAAPDPAMNNGNDEDLLELLDGAPGSDSVAAKQKSKRKWGKKNRKNRNTDPYGCHSTPDDVLLAGSDGVPLGVVVNAGKKHGKKGYTRPMGYGSQRRAAA